MPVPAPTPGAAWVLHRSSGPSQRLRPAPGRPQGTGELHELDPKPRCLPVTCSTPKSHSCLDWPGTRRHVLNDLSVESAQAVCKRSTWGIPSTWPISAVRGAPYASLRKGPGSGQQVSYSLESLQLRLRGAGQGSAAGAAAATPTNPFQGSARRGRARDVRRGALGSAPLPFGKELPFSIPACGPEPTAPLMPSGAPQWVQAPAGDHPTWGSGAAA